MTDEEIDKAIALRRFQLVQLVMLRRCIQGDEFKLKSEIFELEQEKWKRGPNYTGPGPAKKR